MELMVVVVIAAILYVSSIPDSSAVAEEGKSQFAEKFEADLSYAKSLSIADPSDPVILKVDPDTNKYWLAKNSTPDTPITNPSTKKPYVVEGHGGSTATGAMKKIEILATDFNGDQVLKFDSVGTMDQRRPARIRLRIGGKVVDVEIDPRSMRARPAADADATLVSDGDGRLVDASDDGEIETENTQTNDNANANAGTSNNTNTNESGGLVKEVVKGLGL